MKTKILGLLAVTLLAAPMASNAVPSTGTYDLTLTGETSGGGSFYFDATTGLATNISFTIGAIALSNGSFGTFGASAQTCFVEWALTPPNTTCGSALGGFGATFPGTTISYDWFRSNVFILSDDVVSARYTGTYAASLRAVPEPGTLALLGLGLLGLGVSRKRKAA